MEYGLVTYRNQIGISFFYKDCHFLSKPFHEENKHAFVKSNFSASVILLVKFANSIEHLIQKVSFMHYSNAIIRNRVALQELSFG